MFNGAKVKRIRTELGWSQRTLAQKSGLGCGHISEIENGKSDPTSSTIERLAAALGVPVTALFAGGDETPGDATKTGTE